MPDPAKPLRVLVSEGSSTSAREAITILGLVGPSRRGLRSLALVPGAVLALRAEISPLSWPAGRSRPAIWPSSSSCWPTGQFDVLLPTHEQGFLFARVRQRLEGRVGLALPSFESYRTAHSKAGFSRLLDRLDLPQPPTHIVTSAQRIARRHPVSRRRQDFGRHRKPRHLVRARCRRSRHCVARSRAQAAHLPTRCWCRISSRARPRRRSRCFAAAG